MAIKDLFHNLTVDTLYVNQTVTATPTIAGIDGQGKNSVLHIADLGDSGDTLSGSVYIELIIQDSDDNSTFAAVTEATYVNAAVGATAGVGLPDSSGVFATINAPAEDSIAFVIGYRGPKRYSRINPVLTGTHTNGIPLAVLAIGGHLDRGNQVNVTT